MTRVPSGAAWNVYRQSEYRFSVPPIIQANSRPRSAVTISETFDQRMGPERL